MGLVPKATKAENKMAFGLSFVRLMGFVMTLMLSVSVGDSYVHTSFRLLFTIFCCVMYLILNLPAPHNPKRRIWNGMLLWLSSKSTPHVYQSMIGFAYKEVQDEAR